MAEVLIMDDQPYLRELFSEVLVDEGYSVKSVAYAESMMECLKHSCPDLVLLGLYPDAFEAEDILREIKTWDHEMPVVVVTAYDKLMDDSIGLSTEGCVLKSFSNLTELKRKIADILRSKDE